MTPKKDALTPKAAIKWLEDLRKISERRGGGATNYQIRYMFKYIERILQYQEVMQPITDEEGRFKCPRCGVWQVAESGSVDDYTFCSLCGQRWKDTPIDD